MDKKNKTKLNKLPQIFSEISDRFASDYMIAYKLYLDTKIKIDSSRFPISLIVKFQKEEEDVIFSKIFDRIVENDKELFLLLKKAKIENLKIRC